MFKLLRNLLMIIDKFLNVVLLGSPHKTISMRLSFATLCVHVKPRYSWVVTFAHWVDILFCNRLYCLECDHIYKSYEAEEILFDGLWRWYVVTDQGEFDDLVNQVMNVRFLGRI